MLFILKFDIIIIGDAMNINVSGAFFTYGISLVSLIYALLVLLLYFIKGKSHKISSKLYFYLIIMTIIVAFVNIIASLLIVNNHYYANFFGRTTVFLINCWNFLLVFYISVCFKSDEENRKFFSKYSYVYFLTCFVLVLINLIACIFLDFEYVKVGEPYVFGGALNVFISIFGLLAILYAIVNVIIYRKKLDKLAIILGVYSIVLCSICIILHVTGLVPTNNICFQHAIGILYLYLSIESQDALLITEFKESTSKADEYNKLRTDFIMNMSHELRTPLTSILGFSDSLISSDFTLDELKEDSKNIYYASKKLLDLINSIIDVSKLDSNKEVINNDNYTLDTVIYDISSNINSYITKDNLVFTINATENCFNDLVGDDKKINKILNILLMTAVDHTDYGEVSLNIFTNIIDSVNCELVFHIKNSGHALSINDFDRSLDDLIKLSGNNDNSIDSKTLNLIIAKSLVEVIGGSIDFINETGKGTQFIIKLKQKFTTQNKLGNIKEKIQTKHVLSQQILDLSDKKVLIVDDNKINIDILVRLLEQYSINIDTSVNPNDGVSLFSANNYDIIFVADNMEDVSGIDFIGKLNSTGNKVPPIIGIINKNSANISEYFDILESPIEFRRINKIINKVFVEGGDINEL